MKICKDGRIWGQNNKEASQHLGILTGRKNGRKKGSDGGWNQGANNPMYQHIYSIETRRKMSEAKRGSKSPSWKGGISSLNARIRRGIEFKLWRSAVFARDNWTCQDCGQRRGRLNAHHIKLFSQYPELRFAIDNGETLCMDCHMKRREEM